MFRLFTKGTRARAAIMMIAAYAFCVTLPHVALALSDGRMAIHCLNVPDAPPVAHDHTAMSHDHSDGMNHSIHDGGSAPQPKNGHGKSHSDNCCGVFCMSSLAAVDSIDIRGDVVRSSSIAIPVASLAGADPDLPYRPPNI